MNGKFIANTRGHPSLPGGNLSIYSANDAARKADIELPLTHPGPYLPFSVGNDEG